MDRDRLVDVGVALISKFGAKALSLTSVARQAGVARATAYRMFGGRDALVAAIVQRELELLRAKVVEWDREEPEVPARVRRRVVETLRYLREHEALQYVLTREPEEVVGALISGADSERTSFVQMVVDATLPDLCDDEAALLYPDPRGAVEFMVRLVYSCMLVPSGAMSDDEIADLVVRAIVRVPVEP